jgi:hypothetical protein
LDILDHLATCPDRLPAGSQESCPQDISGKEAGLAKATTLHQATHPAGQFNRGEGWEKRAGQSPINLEQTYCR